MTAHALTVFPDAVTPEPLTTTQELPKMMAHATMTSGAALTIMLATGTLRPLEMMVHV